MIYTLTLNPSVDYIVEVEGFQLGELNRTSKETKFPGGKGINVSRVLKQMGMTSKAFGFTGGFTGKYIDEFLQSEEIETDFIKVDEDTRINIKLKSRQETEINGQGPKIQDKDFQQLKEKIQQLSSNDMLVLAGSIPGSLAKTTYEELVKICSEQGTEFIVDAEGDLLKKVLVYHPFLIKPNHHELGELFQTSITNCEEVIPFGKKLVEMGAKNVIVSLADKGAVFINNEISLIAKAPKGKVRNSVGAGDSMVAGFLAEYQKEFNYTDAFRYSVASGSATAFSLGLCTKESVAAILSQVHIKNIS
ncbi:1-phosphofructokinase [Neobacillus sp. PS3-40]|uniref:1-phosphofructokinase n=1 Tax=Neobacillus sp. PS3-40 TaxID=3070679 RepID=UPI0027E105A3|nr:1-phosphofructokinase [Neobacillus sp. PS3-40]WML44964.1 1-phosphofructokinase [Neobacillus sp. PS3-40]